MLLVGLAAAPRFPQRAEKLAADSQQKTAEDPNMLPLKLYYNDARRDNFTTATSEGERDARGAGYRFARVECYLLRNQSSDNVPLKLFYSDARGDNFTAATGDGERAAKASGYRYVRVEGYLYPDGRPGTVPLKLYYSDVRGDNFTTATPEGERDAKASGYRYVRIEGYVFPNNVGGGGGDTSNGPDLSGTWTVTIQSTGDELQGDWTRTDRWEFTSLGGGKWHVRLTVLSSRQDKEGDISGGNPVGKTFEETYTTVNDGGGGRFRLIVPDGQGGVTEMPGTYGPSQFSINYSDRGVQYSYNGIRQ
jgi:hypothetical protein